MVQDGCHVLCNSKALLAQERAEAGSAPVRAADGYRLAAAGDGVVALFIAAVREVEGIDGTALQCGINHRAAHKERRFCAVCSAHAHLHDMREGAVTHYACHLMGIGV